MKRVHANFNIPIYLDYLSTTPCAPEVLDAIIPYFCEQFGNPSSAHYLGQLATHAIRNARKQVASLLEVNPDEVLFTGSATESNNLLLRGVGKVSTNGRRKIVTSAIEHKSVLEPVKALAQEGFVTCFLSVDKHGLVNLREARTLIDSSTLLVSIQAVNNEIGTIQPINHLAKLAHKAGALFHTDAVQALGKIPFSLKEVPIDFASVSSHKMYGPKGAAALFIRGGLENSKLAPLMRGGSQEAGLRPGTLNVPAIVGFGVACEIARNRIVSDMKHIQFVRDKFESEIKRYIAGATVNGDANLRIPGCSSICFPNARADELLANCPALAASLGSACTSGTPEPSYVLKAIGMNDESAKMTIRFSFGRTSNIRETQTAARLLKKAYNRLTLPG